MRFKLNTTRRDLVLVGRRLGEAARGRCRRGARGRELAPHLPLTEPRLRMSTFTDSRVRIDTSRIRVGEPAHSPTRASAHSGTDRGEKSCILAPKHKGEHASDRMHA
eukprot:2796275-Pleurochrysis_carterae.AAC.3